MPKPTTQRPVGYGDLLHAARNGGIAAGALELPKTLTPADWIQLFPLGDWVADPMIGSSPHITSELLTQIVGNFARYKIRPFFDLDHSSFWGSTKAYGWVEELELRDGGLWARVEWTEEGAALLASRSYRYLSPLWAADWQDAKSGQHVGGRLLSVALTNMPFFDTELEQVLAAQGGRPMNPKLKALAAAMKLPETATEEEIVTALGTQLPQLQAQAAAQPILEAIRAELKLPTTAAAADYLERIKQPANDLTALRSEVDALKLASRKERAGQLVAAAMAAGKITEATKPYYLEQAEADPDKFGAFAATMPVVVPVTTAGGTPPPTNPAVLTEEDRAFCRKMGYDPEKFAASRAQATA